MLTTLMMLVFTLLMSMKLKKFSWMYMTLTLLSSTMMSLLFTQPSNYTFEMKHKFLMTDALSTPIIILTLWITALMLMSSFKILKNKLSIKLFLFLVGTLCIILLFTFMTTNFLIFYISFEASLIPTLILILLWGVQPERLQATSYFILYTVTASLPLLLSLMLIFKTNNSLFLFLNFWHTPVKLSIHPFWWSMTILAFLVKMPMYTTHLWLPKAHVEAPVAGSMILAAVLLKLGSYGFLRVSLIFPNINMIMISPIASIALLGSIISGMICIRQQDMKALIAYASVSHMGLLIAAMLTSSMWGWQGSLAMMFAHGICSSAMFSSINMIYEITSTRSLYIVKGMMSIIPSYSMWLFIILMANMATPPSINLITEIILITSISAMSTKFIIILMMTAFLSAVYSLYLFSASQHGMFPNHLKPMNLFSNRNMLILILHSAPLFLLNLRMDSIFMWC